MVKLVDGCAYMYLILFLMYTESSGFRHTSRSSAGLQGLFRFFSLYSNFLPLHWETANICNVLMYVVPLLSLAYISVHLSSSILYQFILLIFFPLLTIV